MPNCYEWTESPCVCLSVLQHNGFSLTAEHDTASIAYTDIKSPMFQSSVTHPGQCSKFCHLIVCDVSQTESWSVIFMCERMKVQKHTFYTCIHRITFLSSIVTGLIISSLASLLPLYVKFTKPYSHFVSFITLYTNLVNVKFGSWAICLSQKCDTFLFFPNLTNRLICKL